jgi:hypothetical protein
MRVSSAFSGPSLLEGTTTVKKLSFLEDFQPTEGILGLIFGEGEIKRSAFQWLGHD